MKKTIAFLFAFMCLFVCAPQAARQQLWHGRERSIDYRAGGNDFVCVNGKMRFNRALYLLNNIIFTSQWDNYPKQISMPLSGAASHIHLLMAGSTNAMQSRLVNGEVLVQYKDGTGGTHHLINPQNWWPIEVDYFTGGFAFITDAPIPLRLCLRSGTFAWGVEKYSTIKGYSNQVIEVGAATVLDMPLNALKEHQSLTLRTIANDVVIGLLSVTLQRGPP